MDRKSNTGEPALHPAPGFAHRARLWVGVSLLAFAFGAQAATSSSNLYFATSGQDIWGSGGALPLSYNDFFGPIWGNPYPADHYKYYDLDPAGDIWWATSGKIGVGVDINGTAGSMSLRYPMQVNLTFPDTNTLYAGSTFSIGSSFNPVAGGFGVTKYAYDAAGNLQPYTFNTGAPLLQTVGPAIHASLDAVMDVKAVFSGSLFGVSLPIIGPDFNSTYNLLKVDPAQGSNIDLIPGILSGYAQAPNLNSRSAGLTGNSVESSMRDGVGGLNLNIVNLITQALGMPPLSGSIAGVNYDVLSAGLGVALDIEQAFNFTPQPVVHLDFTSPVDVFSSGTWQRGLSSVDFLAGDSVTLRARGAYDLGVKPTVSLYNVTTNDTDAIISASVALSALGLSVPSLGLDIGPVLHPDPYKLDLRRLDLYDKSFLLNTGSPLSANVFNIGFKNRYEEVPLGESLVDYCALNPSAPGCSGIDFSDLSRLEQCILDRAGQCANFEFRVRAPTPCAPGNEGQPCFALLPELYRVNGDCHANDPLDCAIHDLVATLSDALWDDGSAKWVFFNSGLLDLGEIALATPSTDQALAQRFASLGFDPAVYRLSVPGSVPEPASIVLLGAGAFLLGRVRKSSSGAPLLR